MGGQTGLAQRVYHLALDADLDADQTLAASVRQVTETPHDAPEARLELLDGLGRDGVARGEVAGDEQRIGAHDRYRGLLGRTGESEDGLTVDEQVGVAETDLKGDVRDALEQAVTQVVGDQVVDARDLQLGEASAGRVPRSAAAERHRHIASRGGAKTQRSTHADDAAVKLGSRVVGLDRRAGDVDEGRCERADRERRGDPVSSAHSDGIAVVAAAKRTRCAMRSVADATAMYR